VSPAVGWAVLVGIAFGLGTLLVVAGAPSLGPARLADRIAAAVAPVSPGAREHLQRRAEAPGALAALLDGPIADAARFAVAGVLSDRSTIERRLRRSGSTVGVQRYRTTRLVVGILGALLGTVLAIAFVFRGAPVAVMVVVPIAGVLAAASVDVVQERRARARAARLVDELPVVLEFLAMSLSAGEGMVDALRRVAAVGRGELAAELGGVVVNVAAGGSIAAELRQLSTALELPPLQRSLEQLIGALERGAPVAEVLRAQAQDAREDERARLLESVGKTEVRMLVPLVLIILPATVVLAIWPGIMVLRLGF